MGGDNCKSISTVNLRESWRETPGDPVVRTLLSLLRVQVQSLFGKLRSCKLHGGLKKESGDSSNWWEKTNKQTNKKPYNNFVKGMKKGVVHSFSSIIGNITAEGNDSGEREAPGGQREENCWKDVFKGKKGCCYCCC